MNGSESNQKQSRDPQLALKTNQYMKQKQATIRSQRNARKSNLEWF